MLRLKLKPNHNILNGMLVLTLIALLLAGWLHLTFREVFPNFWLTWSLTLNIVLGGWWVFLGLFGFVRSEAASDDPQKP